ncbi:MAG: AAA family ATPase [Thermodesulfobacteriota bacterium]|nr:AAA family ATPase [Thermodesulfobacteriota bacterium]
MTANEKAPVIIAVCGKGGVGKTSISALLTRMLLKDSTKRILAIDADPAIGLSYPLGVPVHKTVDEIRNDFIADVEKGMTGSKEELIRRLDYEMLDAMTETENLAFLAIGRPEGDGCYCQVNSLLRDIIKAIARNFDIVVIDGEAGVEQIDRRVMDMVTHLFLVSDASARGRNVAATIDRVAQNKPGLKKTGIFFNRLQGAEEMDALTAQAPLSIIGWMAENALIRELDRDGKPFPDVGDGRIPFPEEAVYRFLKQ